MLRHLYNALWYPALPVALALSGGARDAGTRRARMGLAWAGDGAAPSAEPRIWAHAASVGEVGALRYLVDDFGRSARERQNEPRSAALEGGKGCKRCRRVHDIALECGD